MATPKQVVLNDLQIGKIILQLSDDGMVLHAEGVYVFLDDQATPQVVEEIDPRRVKRSVPWENIPQNIRDGIVAVRDFLYSGALSDEGME